MRHYFLLISVAFLQSSCFLNASIQPLNSQTTSESTKENPTSPSISDPINLKTSQLMAVETSLEWATSDPSIHSYKIVISSIQTPDEHCHSAEVITSNQLSLSLENLLPDTIYYYRICSVVNSQTSKGTPGTFKTLKLITRTSAYNLFPNWNDYLINNGSKYYNASQTTCPGNTPSPEGYSSCINGGLVQKIIIPTSLNCEDLKIDDYLSVFQWNCDSGATETLIYSTDLKTHKGLQDLIANHQFKKNYVIIQINGVNTYASTPETWWTNPIEELPDSPAGGSLNIDNGTNLAGKIYTVSTLKSGGSYLFTSDKLSLVVMKGVVLKKDSNNSLSFVRSSSGTKYLWFEGSYSGNNTPTNVMEIASSAHNRYHNIELKDTSAEALKLGNSINSIISDFHIHHCNGGIVGASSGWGNLIVNGILSNCTGDLLSYLYYSRITSILFSSNSNTLNNALVYRSQSNILSHFTLVNNTTEYGFRMANTSHNLLHNILSINSQSSYFIYAFLSSTNTFSQLMSFGSTSSEVVISNTSGAHKFTNNLVIENATECNIINNTANSPGLAVGTCLNHGPYSNSTLVTSTPDLADFFVGKVILDDSMNSSDNLGNALFGNITDWIYFTNPFRIWGADGSPFPHINNRGPCLSGTCRIWDYRLKATSSNLAYNSTNTVNSKNDLFVAGTTCPSALDGNKVTTYTDFLGTTYTFLTNAMEIMGDGIGNDNSLCESNETCLYTPNFGSYQGSGDFQAQGKCLFQNGLVSNIQIYAYPEN